MSVMMNNLLKKCKVIQIQLKELCKVSQSQLNDEGRKIKNISYTGISEHEQSLYCFLFWPICRLVEGKHQLQRLIASLSECDSLLVFISLQLFTLFLLRKTA